MIATLPFALALILPSQQGWSAPNNGSTIPVPYEVHDAVVKSLQEALEAQSKRDYQLSLALLHGVIYNDGVKVAIDPGSKTPSAAAKQGLAAALDTWSRALTTDNPIKFTSNAAEANITINFVDKVPRSGHDALGLIELKKQYRWNKSRYETEVTGTIYIQTHYEKHSLDATQFSEVIAHEFGHLLGLDDMPNTGQLMGPMIVEKPVTKPNQRETYAVQFVRSQAKKQWNSVLQAIQTNPAANQDDRVMSFEQQYLATCTGRSPCKQGKS